MRTTPIQASVCVRPAQRTWTTPSDKSSRPDITGARTAIAPRTIYSAGVGFRSAALRHGDWKLVVTRAAEGKPAKEELFNLAVDLGEATNLAAAKPEILADLKRRLETIAASDKEAMAND